MDLFPYIASGIILLFLLVRIMRLQDRLADIEHRLSRLEGGAPRTEPVRATSAASPQRAQTASHKVTVNIDLKSASLPPPESTGATAPPSAPIPTVPSAEPAGSAQPQSETWRRIERQIVENWTGIIGAVILAVGIGFLGVLAAIALSPLFRFLMLIGVFVALFILSHLLEKRTNWEKFASWIRGIAGAVLLFACFGSAAVPGLRWIEDQSAALALIAAGVAVNLRFAWSATRQAFASLHLMLSLVTLAILPQELPVFILAGIVSLSGVIFAYRSRWEHQALLSSASFAIYQIFRFFSAGGLAQEFTMLERGVGISSTALVGGVALLMHYRKVYASDQFGPDERRALVSHLVHWFATALGSLLYATGLKWNTLILLGISALCFLLARRARRVGILWLYRTDTLVAQAIALLATLTLRRWNADPMIIASVLYIESLLFVSVMLPEKDLFLETIGRILSPLLGLGLFLTVMFGLNYSDPSATHRHAVLLVVLIAASVIFERRVHGSPPVPDGPFKRLRLILDNNLGFSFAEGISGLLMIALHACLIRDLWAGAVMALLQIGILFIGHRQARSGDTRSAWGLLASFATSLLILWVHLFSGEGREYGATSVMIATLPFSVSTLMLAVWPAVQLPPYTVSAPGVALFTLHLAASTLRIAAPVTPLLPGTVWLLFSLIALEAGLWMLRRTSIKWRGAGRSVVLASFALVVGFVIRHIFVELQAERYLGSLPVRSLIEGFAVLASLYWLYASPPSGEEGRHFWRRVQPLFLEGAILLTIIGFELELTRKWMMLVYALLPFLFFLLAARFTGTHPDRLSRLRLYGLFLFWVAAFHLAFLSVISEMPPVHWLDRAWITGAASLALLIAFVPIIYRHGRLNECNFPEPLRGMARVGSFLEKRRNIWIFDPLFLAAALFLYWSFDRAILTLLWVGLIFAIFSLSILLREGHFRILALIALAASLGRLLFFDLSQSSMTMRAIVFVGVGILMLGMNSLYNRFKDRFQ